MICLLIFILIAVDLSIGILEPPDNEISQSIAPEPLDENNPSLGFSPGVELTPVAYNEVKPTPDLCVGTVDDLQPIGKFRVRRDCYNWNLKKPEETNGERIKQPVAPEAQPPTGHVNGNEGGNENGNRNGNGNGKYPGSDTTPRPAYGAGNSGGPPNFPFGDDPLDECKRYFNVFAYVVCDSGKPIISSPADMVEVANALLPDQETFTLNRCTQGMFHRVGMRRLQSATNYG